MLCASRHALHVRGVLSNDLFDAGNWAELRRRLEDEGFLFVKGVLHPRAVNAARIAVLTQACADGFVVSINPQNGHITQR